MQQKIDEQLSKEKDDMERRMKQKRDEVMGEKKKNLDERMQQMSGQLSSIYREQIMKQYEEELSNLEKAIIEERDKQLTRMRQNLIKRRIDRERTRKEEERKIADSKRQAESPVAFNMLAMSPTTQTTSPLKSVRGAIVNRLAEQIQISLTSKNESQQDTRDKLRQLLNEWNEKLNAAKQNSNEDKQNVWEKESDMMSMGSPSSKTVVPP